MGREGYWVFDDVADEDEYDEFDELPTKESRTCATEQCKIIKNPKFIRGQLNDPSSPMYMGIKP